MDMLVIYMYKENYLAETFENNSCYMLVHIYMLLSMKKN